jgi:signal transduction histidine kinase
MLSPLATLLLTWAAIYAFVGAYYSMLHLRRPTQREYLVFGLLCFGLTVWSAGSALLADASDFEAAVAAERIQQVGGYAMMAFFADFASELAGRPSRRFVRASYVWCGVAIVLLAAGLLIDADRRPPTSAWAPAGASHPDPSLTWLGEAFAWGTIVIASWAVWAIARGVRREPDLRWLVWASAVAVLAGVHDIVVQALRIRSVHLAEHAALVPVLTVSFLLLRRFVRAADELTDRTRELRRSYGELRVTQEALVRKEQLAAVGELSAVIAHEVRNPLAIIKNAASSLKRPSLRASDRSVLLGILDEELDRLSRLVRDLLAYARPVEPRGRAIEVRHLLEEAVQPALRQRDSASAVDLHLEAAAGTTLHGDPDLLRQAVANVADNAVQSMPDGGTLTVRAEATALDGEPAVAIEFRDTGAGMDEEVLAKARDPFFTTRPAGTGLGLAIVERVVKNHGGTLAVESATGRGTAVRITLPRQRPSSMPPPPDDEEEALP